MVDFTGIPWPAVLALGNLILSSAIVLTAFSLLGYMLTHNLRSPVAQTFSALLACVLIVFALDVVIPRVESDAAVRIWLRIQWIGIAMVPAAYLHFSDAVLRTTRHFSTRRRSVVVATYLISLALVYAALFTDRLVNHGDFRPPLSHLAAGPLYPVFVAYFVFTGIYGAYNVIRARRRCLTPAARRRMTYLTLSFAAPGLGVFPYLITSGLSEAVSPLVVLLMAMTSSIIVGTMLVVMAYSVAYYGVLTPDRVVKHDLMHYLLRGPVVGILVIAVMLTIPRVELVLGLPRDVALIFAVVGVLVLGQLGVSAARPWIDRFLNKQDQEEIAWIQTLEQRLLTSSDLRQFLTNILIGLCELLRVDRGFLLVPGAGGLAVEAITGDLEPIRRFARSREAQELWDGMSQGPTANGWESFRPAGEYWVYPLHSQDKESLLGLLAVRGRSPEIVLAREERAEADVLLAQAASAIADRHVQEGVFSALQRILPDLEKIQEWRTAARYAPPLPRPPAPGTVREIGPRPWANDGLWQQWVKEALSHFWGGPKLTDSPLLQLHAVRQALKENDGNLTRALRTVLQEAIERQRPGGERKLTAAEWLLYNILELRFVQGMPVRDIARKLAMSESDLYRKQRAAVAEVAKALAEMESDATSQEPSGDGASAEPAMAPVAIGN